MQVECGSFHCRVVVIGDASVGKTSILNQLVDHSFQEHEQSTVGANYQLFVQEIDGVKIEIQIWDTAGEEKFRSLGPIYFRNSLGAVVVYDVTSRKSFQDLESWVNSFQEVAGPETIITIVGNKIDKIDIAVSTEEAAKWADQRGFEHFRTSAKTGEGIRETFRQVAVRLLKSRVQKGRNKKIDLKGEVRNQDGCKC